MVRWKEIIKDGLSLASSPFFPRRNAARILVYHSIGTEIKNDKFGLSIDLETFKAHVHAVAGSSGIVSAEDAAFIESTSTKIAITFDDGFRDNIAALEFLADRCIPSTVFITTDFIGRKSYLDQNELMYIAKLPYCRIGAHGKTHSPLASLDKSQQREELTVSKDILEQILNCKVDLLAYPHGSYNSITKKLAAEIGYSAAFTTKPCSISGMKSDRFAISRFTIGGHYSPEKVVRYSTGYYDFLGYLSHLNLLR